MTLLENSAVRLLGPTSSEVFDVSRDLVADAAERPALTEQADFLRIDGYRKLVPGRRSVMGQYPTPLPVAHLMASMFEARMPDIRLLDAGAGVGSLSAAFVEEVCRRDKLPRTIALTGYEIEPLLADYLNHVADLCARECSRAGVEFASTVKQEDFIEAGVSLAQGLFGQERFNCVIMNPPYAKMSSASQSRRLLRSIGVETSNLYAAFLSIAIKLLDDGGELVAITPRSFCNGTYFKPFRRMLLGAMTIRRIHIFESRQQAFKEDEVLQENIIFHAVKERPRAHSVLITCNDNPLDEDVLTREIESGQLVNPNDPDLFLHIVPDSMGQQIAAQVAGLTCSLADLGLSVSTGRVVQFRAVGHLREHPERNTVPLIHANHLERGCVRWPMPRRGKPDYIVECKESADLLIPSDTHVLVKRFSAKEETRRVAAALYDPRQIATGKIGFENHLNYFHRGGKGLDWELAKGLTVFLNSSLVDYYFRQFNGHTQVNARDLEKIKYPTPQQLIRLGKIMDRELPDQSVLDRLVDKELTSMAGNTGASKALKARRKIEQALSALEQLGLPKEQQNDRSALTLLSLLDLKPATPWSKASNPMMGITPMMDFFAEHYGRKYAPNTRETVRRQTIHQFLQAGLVVANPDKSRPVNSPDTVYQVVAVTLNLLRTFGGRSWSKSLDAYRRSVKTLRERYAAERTMEHVSAKLPDGARVKLTSGLHNVLIKHVLEDFCGYYAPGCEVAYIGDTGDKSIVLNETLLAELDVVVDRHGKMPDVVVYCRKRNWLVLIEAVTSHGPVDAKRHEELRRLFDKSRAGLVYVTAFPDRRTMAKYLDDISWETEVWVAQSPTHIVHFNGQRFLGPYKD